MNKREIMTDSEICLQFKRVAERNGESADEILQSFMKDYIVSGGHPEQVTNKWPWNKTNTAKEDQ